MKKIKTKINNIFFKRAFAGLFVLLFIFGVFFIPIKHVDAQGSVTIEAPWLEQIVDFYGRLNMKEDKKKEVEKEIDDTMSGYFSMFIRNAWDSFSQRMAKKIAVGLASSAKGEKPLSETMDMGRFLNEAKDSAIGDAIDAVGTWYGLGNLCKPDLFFRLKMSMALLKIEEPPEPKCTWKKMEANWIEAAQDKNLLKNFSLSFKPYQSDIGIMLNVKNKKDMAVAEKARIEELKRGADNWGGFKPLTDFAGNIKSTASTFFNMEEQKLVTLYSKERTNTENISALKHNAKSLILPFAKTLLASLYNEVIKEYFNGIYTAQDAVNVFDKLCEDKPILCGKSGGDSLSNPNAQAITGGKKAAKAKYSKMYDRESTVDIGEYDVLPELSSCLDPKKPGPTTCVIDKNFASAIGQQLTLREAIESGKLDGEKPFGYSASGDNITYIEGYPYRSILILRKYRIIPVGWELAAQYKKEIEKYNPATVLTLNFLINKYNDDTSPYYKLVDPDWVLKLPSGYCYDTGYGPEIASDEVVEGVDLSDPPDNDWSDKGDTAPKRSITRNDQYCTHEASCITNKTDGTCKEYGYCMEERRLWKFDGETCEENHNTCQTFSNPDEVTVSYLKNSLDWDGCNKNNSGCQWYCDDFNKDERELVAVINSELVRENAVMYFNFDDGSVLDQTSNNNDGTLQGGAVTTTGNWGDVLDLDGADDYVSIPNSSTLNFGDGKKDYPFSISAWVKTDDNTTSQTIVSKYSASGDRQYIFKISGQNLGIMIFTDGSKSLEIKSNSDFLQANKWYHLVATYDGSSDINGLSLYVNGIKQTNITRIPSGVYVAMRTTTQPIRIGAHDPISAAPFDGKIDEVVVYNKELSEKEIQNKYMNNSCLFRDDKMYLSGLAESCEKEDAGCGEYLEAQEGLIAFWQFERGEGDKIYDSAGNISTFPGNDYSGLITEATWTNGQIGRALTFDGTNDVVNIDNESSFDVLTNSTSTISFWLRQDDSSQAERGVLQKRDTSNNDKLFCQISNQFLCSYYYDSATFMSVSTPVDNDTWTHFAIVNNIPDKTISLYKNGALVDTGSNANIVEGNNDEPLILGYAIDATNDYFMGQLDEFAIFNRALSRDKIQNIYSNNVTLKINNIKVPNKNLQCFGRTSNDALFDLPIYVNNCITLGDQYDSFGEGTCFEFVTDNDALSIKKRQDNCAEDNGTWLIEPIDVARYGSTSCLAMGGIWSSGECVTQCLRLDSDVCDNYAFSCKESEVGCDKYTPTNGNPWVPGVVAEDDYCPSECAGYDTYKQEATNFETSEFPVNFIPSTAKSCSASGCDEFTNLSTLTSGGENLEYYTYLRQCKDLPTATSVYQCGTFYTWVGSDVTGYQLQSYFLESGAYQDLNGDIVDDEEPLEILRVEEDLGSCDNANDALTNANCKEFYNDKGVISYHLLKKTISCSANCSDYRKTTPSEFDLDRVCKNIGGTWVSGSPDQCSMSSETACDAVGGTWASATCAPASITDSSFCGSDIYLDADWSSGVCTKTDYKAISTQGVSCLASANGCREYTGNAGNNIRTVFEDIFEGDSYIYDFPDFGTGWSGGALSSESTIAGQQSLRVDSGISQTISKWLSATCSLSDPCLSSDGCDCSETVFGNIDGDTTPAEVVCKVSVDETDCSVANYTYNKGTYLLSFWAKGNNGDNIIINISDGTSTQSLGNRPIDDQWGLYTVGPFEFDVEDFGDYKLNIGGIGSTGGTPASLLSTYIDNIRLKEVTNSIYAIKDSWNTPTSCDEDFDGNLYLYYMLGCEEYLDTQDRLTYLKSFSDLCRAEAVGCRDFIDTHNFSGAYTKTWNDGPDTSLPPTDEVSVPSNNIVYLAQTFDYSCLPDSVGCSLLGEPDYNQDKTIIKNTDEVYKINDPDRYDASDAGGSILCLEKNVGCNIFWAGSSDYYFKDPRDQFCEYVKPVGANSDGWYKKANQYDSSSELCPVSDYQNFGSYFPSGTCVGGSDDGSVCLSAWDAHLDDLCINGGGYCSSGGVLCVGGTEAGNSCESSCTAGGGYCNNWAGTCPATKSSCTTFVDPLSEFDIDKVLNSSFLRNLDTTDVPDAPDNWVVTGGALSDYVDGYVDVMYQVDVDEFSPQFLIDLDLGKFYTLTTDIQSISAVDAVVNVTCAEYFGSGGTCPNAGERDFYLADNMGSVSSTCSTGLNNIVELKVSSAELSATELQSGNALNRYSMRFFTGDCKNAKLVIGGDGGPQRFDRVSVKETGVYTYLDNSLDDAKSECSGVNNIGCVLLNNRENVDWKTLNYNNYLTYDSDITAELIEAKSIDVSPSKCEFVNGVKFACNTDTLMKVKADRDCKKWLYCDESRKEDGQKFCSKVALCDKMDKSGNCINNPLEYSNLVGVDIENMTFNGANINKIKNLSGYSKVGFDWGAGDIIEGNLPPAQMTPIGVKADLMNGDFESWSSVAEPGKCSITTTTSCLKNADCPDEVCVIKDWQHKPTDWNNYLCGGSGSVCDNDSDCTFPIVCAKSTWSYDDYGLINNPKKAQDVGLDIFNGQSVLRLTSGSISVGDGWAISDDINVINNTEYVISGYINTKNLTSSTNAIVYGAIIVYGDTDMPFPTVPSYPLKVQSGSDWTFVQAVFTTNSVSTTGNIRIKLADIDNTNSYCPSCSGQIYFDDITIMTALKSQESQNQYGVRLCRRYPQSNSLSCEYEYDDGYRETRGWYGYCLEFDPVYPEYCLNWYPTDEITDSNALLEQYGYQFRSDSRSPLYYCLQERRTISCEYDDDADSFTTTPSTYCDKVVQVVQNSGANIAWNGRTNSVSGYMVPTGPPATGDLDYTYSTAYSHFGAIQDLSDNPIDWSRVESPNVYSPYSCSTMNEPAPSTNSDCNFGNNDGFGFTCDVNDDATCTIIDEDVFSKERNKGNDFGPEELKTATGGDYDVCIASVTSTDGSAGVSLNNGVWSWWINDAKESCGGIGGYCESSLCNMACDPTKITVRCTHTLTAINPCTIPITSNDAASNIVSSEKAADRVKRIFAQSYGNWDWNESSGTYEAVGTNSWVPVSAPCPGGVRPPWPDDWCGINPVITNLTINDTSSAGTVVIEGTSSVSLKFNSKFDIEQLPMTGYNLAWIPGADENTITSATMAGKSNILDPHEFNKEFSFGTVAGYESFASVVCGSDCSADGGCATATSSSTTKAFCTFTPTVEITDNWGFSGTDIAPTIYIISDL